MGLNITLGERKDTPIYKQISDALLADIRSGKLEPGFKLPTVRELADEMKISKGTIKHAYEYLEQLGAIEMVQGSGSFVLGNEDDNLSRKEKAMASIDRLFTELQDLGFTPREMEIYLNLKLKGLEEKYEFLKVAVLDCNPESLKLMEKQLSKLEYIEAATFSLDSLYNIADKLVTEYDMVMTTSTHYDEVEAVVRNAKPMAMLAMVTSTNTIVQLAKISDDNVVGVCCASKNFVNIIRSGCMEFGNWGEIMESWLFGRPGDLQSFLNNKDVIIVPYGWEEFASAKEREALKAFEEMGGNLISYGYVIDKGSFIHLEAKTKKWLNNKKST